MGDRLVRLLSDARISLVARMQNEEHGRAATLACASCVSKYHKALAHADSVP
jgi:hypothetical protein